MGFYVFQFVWQLNEGIKHYLNLFFK